MENIKISQGDRDPIPLEEKKGLGFKTIIVIIVLSLVFGIIGGGGGVYLLLTRGGSFLKPYLGTSNSSIPTTVNEKLKLEESSKVTDAVEKVKPTVVSIVATAQVTGFFNTTETQQSAGSGLIITSDGLIMTNKHVVSDTAAKYTVFTNDGKSYSATVQSLDPSNDLAVIKIDAKDLPVVDIGDSEDMKIGQYVIAIGNALGEFQNTVTLGVLSAKERSITASSGLGQSEKLEGLLQTDAAINPGNSGGPLVNLEGQVIGVNTAVASQGENIGFAIPSSLIKGAIDSIKKNNGKIIRPLIGVRYASLTPEIAKANNISVDYGAYIYSGSPSVPAVIPGGPADKAGLKAGDTIIAINGEKMDANHSLTRLVQKYQPGDQVDITYLRDKTESTVKLILSSTE